MALLSSALNRAGVPPAMSARESPWDGRVLYSSCKRAKSKSLSRQACNPEPLPFEIVDLLDVFRADEQIGRGVARSGGDFEVAVGSFIPDDDVVGIDIGEVKLARHQSLQLDIGSPDADEVDLNSFLRVQVFSAR